MATVGSVGISTALADTTGTAGINGSVSGVDVDPAVSTNDTNTTVLIRFNGSSPDGGAVTSLSGDDGTQRDHRAGAVVGKTGVNETTERVRKLRTRARSTRAPFERFVATTDGITIDQRLWVINGVVVTFDPKRASVADMAGINNVSSIQTAITVKTATATPMGAAPAPATRRSIPEPADYTTARRRTFGDKKSVLQQGTGESSVSDSLETIRVSGTWDLYGQRGAGVRVAVLDTGVDPDHPDVTLAPGGWAEFDTDGVRVESEPYDPNRNGHGTHVSATVAGGNTSGTAIGVAPDAELLHAKTFAADGTGTFRQVAAGVQWAIENDADVVGMSFGTATQREQVFADLIRTAEAAGVTVVAASGNSGAGTSGSPGDVYESMTVGAIDNDGSVASFSGGDVISRTEWPTPPASWPDTYVVPDVVAPGVDVLSAVPGGGYARLSGTSMATPHAAGVAALVIAAAQQTESREGRDSVPRSVRALLAGTAIDLGAETTRQGAGRIDAYAAVRAVGAPECGTVRYSGTVKLTKNLTSTSACLNIASDDVVIEGEGRTITANGTGIQLVGGSRSNITIRNVTFDGTAAPVSTDDTTSIDGLTLTGVHILDAERPTAIEAEGEIAVESATVEDSAAGFNFANASSATITNVSARNISGDGIVLEGVSTATATHLDIDATGSGLTVRGGALAVSESDLDGQVGPGVRIDSVQRVTIDTTRVVGAPSLRATNGTTQLEAKNLTVDSEAGIGIEAGDVGLKAASRPPAPTNEIAVTGHLRIQSLSEPARLTVPYDLGARSSDTEVVLRRYDADSGWVALQTTQNQSEGTVTGSVESSGVVGGYVPGDSFDTYRTNGRVETAGLIQAIADWRVGQLNTTALLDVIQQWRTDRR
jgi:subtilisin family serine protease